MAQSYNICLDVGGTEVLGVMFNEKREIVCRLKKRSGAAGDPARNAENVITGVAEEMIDAIASCAPGDDSVVYGCLAMIGQSKA